LKGKILIGGSALQLPQCR